MFLLRSTKDLHIYAIQKQNKGLQFILYDLTQVQVGKAYFEMVDYLEADRAFSRARIASPYSLDGMDIYSTVLYVSFHFQIIIPVLTFSFKLTSLS